MGILCRVFVRVWLRVIAVCSFRCKKRVSNQLVTAYTGLPQCSSTHPKPYFLAYGPCRIRWVQLLDLGLMVQGIGRLVACPLAWLLACLLGWSVGRLVGRSVRSVGRLVGWFGGLWGLFCGWVGGLVGWVDRLGF